MTFHFKNPVPRFILKGITELKEIILDRDNMSIYLLCLCHKKMILERLGVLLLIDLHATCICKLTLLIVLMLEKVSLRKL